MLLAERLTHKKCTFSLTWSNWENKSVKQKCVCETKWDITRLMASSNFAFGKSNMLALAELTHSCSLSNGNRRECSSSTAALISTTSQLTKLKINFKLQQNVVSQLLTWK